MRQDVMLVVVPKEIPVRIGESCKGEGETSVKGQIGSWGLFITPRKIEISKRKRFVKNNYFNLGTFLGQIISKNHE